MENSSPESAHEVFSSVSKNNSLQSPGIDPHRRLMFAFLCFFYPCLDSCRLRFLQSHRRLLLPIHSVVCLVTFGLSLPVAISLFPQMSQVQSSVGSTVLCAADSRPAGWEESSWGEIKITYTPLEMHIRGLASLRSPLRSRCLLQRLIKQKKKSRAGFSERLREM